MEAKPVGRWDRPATRAWFGIRLLFRHGYNDTTNAFKAYRREVIENIRPLLSNHFNLTVELPLKAIVRGYSYAVLPTSWRGRKGGRSKLDLRDRAQAVVVAYETGLITPGD